jgi:hypothetical protein
LAKLKQKSHLAVAWEILDAIVRTGTLCLIKIDDATGFSILLGFGKNVRIKRDDAPISLFHPSASVATMGHPPAGSMVSTACMRARMMASSA